jgi:hypothetical protein
LGEADFGSKVKPVLRFSKTGHLALVSRGRRSQIGYRPRWPFDRGKSTHICFCSRHPMPNRPASTALPVRTMTRPPLYRSESCQDTTSSSCQILTVASRPERIHGTMWETLCVENRDKESTEQHLAKGLAPHFAYQGASTCHTLAVRQDGLVSWHVFASGLHQTLMSDTCVCVRQGFSINVSHTRNVALIMAKCYFVGT